MDFEKPHVAAEVGIFRRMECLLSLLTEPNGAHQRRVVVLLGSIEYLDALSHTSQKQATPYVLDYECLFHIYFCN